MEELLQLPKEMKLLRERLTSVPMYNKQGILQRADMSNLVNCWTTPGGLDLALHPEHVGTSDDGQPTITLCSKCAASLNRSKTPSVSLASGVDFGNLNDPVVQQFVEPLRDVEKVILSNVRTYGFIAKVVAPSADPRTGAESAHHVLKTHFISFLHDAPLRTMERLNLLQQAKAAHESIQFVLVGPDKSRDTLMQHLRTVP